MKTISTAHKCSQRSRLKNARLVEGNRCLHPHQLGIEPKGARPGVMNIKPFQSIHTGRMDQMGLVNTRYFPDVPKGIEIRAVTQKEVSALTRQGYQVCVVGTVAKCAHRRPGGVPTSERKFLVIVKNRLEKQKKEVEKQILEICARLRQLPGDDEGIKDKSEKKSKRLFKKGIDEDEMADALYEVYAGCRSKNLFNADFKPIDLIAYLFAMVALKGYGRLDFRSNAKKPFFDFFVKKVAPDLEGVRDNTRESMGNRLRGKLECLFLKHGDRPQMPKSVIQEEERIRSEYEKICGIFHKTQFGRKIKEQFGR